MKKKLSLMLAFVMMVSLFPIVHAEAAFSNVSDSPQYIAEEFETGVDSNKIKFQGTNSWSWVTTGTHNDSKGAVQINPKNKAKLAEFPLRVVSGNTYHISAWVKFAKGASTNPNMSFILRGGSSDITIAASKSQSFASGTWVQITATYKATANIANGTIDFRIGTDNGLPNIWNTTSSYTIVIDDFYVIPDVQPTTDDVILEDNFEAEANVKSGLWRSNHSNPNNIEWIPDGADGTTGAMQVTVPDKNEGARTIDFVNFQFQKRYRLTYYAKAINDDAVGLKAKYVFGYNPKTATDPEVKRLYSVEKFSDVALTKEWQKIEFDIQDSRSYTEETLPYFLFRFGEPDNIGISYAVDEVKLERIGGENAGDVMISGQKSASTPGSIFYQMLINDTRKTFLYRLCQEMASGGDVLLKQGQTKNGQLAFATSELPQDLDSLRLDVVGVNTTNGCSEVASCYLKEAEQADSMSISCDQYIWNDDVKTLSATVRYLNDSNPSGITAYVAQYDNEKRLLGVTPAPKLVAEREDASWKVEADVFDNAVKAKFFAWYDDSVIPATYSCEIDKTTSGEFIYVDANQTTNGDGSFAKPFNTISAAKKDLQTRVKDSTATDFYVVLKGGEYTNNYETLVFTKEDGAPEGKTITYTSLDSDRAKITGAYHIPVGSFSLHDSSKKIYKVSVPAGTQTRQLYVNDIKATRARSAEDAIPFTNLDQHNPAIPGDSNDSMYYRAEAMGPYAITTTDTSFFNTNLYPHPEELELYFISNWRHQFICPDRVVSSTDADGNPVARFEFTTTQQKSDWQWMNRDDAPVGSVMYVENAYELLDEPGEWYLDTHTNTLYYKPRDFENMETADVVIPKTETLIDIIGGLGYTAQNAPDNATWMKNYDNPIQNIAFKNIDFEYTGWNLPTTNRSFRNGQNATFEDPARNPVEYNKTGGKLMAGAVEVKHGKNLTFDNCDFSKIGAMALKMMGAIENCAVTGNEFYEISGSAINLGEVTSVDVKVPSGIVDWVNKEDHSQGVTGYIYDRHSVYNTTVANNYIHKVATDYYAAAAIGAGYPVNTTIRNNDLSDGAYCGIHIGWGWSTDPGMTSGFVIENNFIHNFMNWRLYDGGGIYALGGTRGGFTKVGKEVKEYPRNEMRENYIQDVYNLFGGLYYDNGSHGWDASDNVVDLSNYPILYGTENYLRPNNWLHTTSGVSDIDVKVNYSTTSSYQKAENVFNYQAPQVFLDAKWPEAAQQIINNAGIESQYLNRFDFDLQAIRMAPMVEVAAGKTEKLVYSGVASKDRSVDLTDYTITAKSSNPAVATATHNSVTGVSAGTAWITLEIVRKDANDNVQFYDEHTFRVVVK